MNITMKDIAEKANVSTATVSHVINGTKKISEDTRNKIMNLIQEYNYVPNLTAKNLRQNKTMTAGLIVSSFPDSFITEMVYGVEERARELNYQLLLVNTNENQDYEKEMVKLLHSKMVDGLILSPTNNEIAYLNNYTENNFPIVLVNRYDPVAKYVPRVTGDDFQTGYSATKHLLDHGHTKIGVVYAVPDVSTTNNRIKGYKAALQEYCISYDESYLELGYATVVGGETAVESLLCRNPDITAIFILNDLMTIGGVSKLKKLSLEIPNDVALIGVGDFAS